MQTRQGLLAALLAAALIAPLTAHAQSSDCEHRNNPLTGVAPTFEYGPPVAAVEIRPAPEPNPFELRALKYATVAMKHRVEGLASYYSTSLDGTLTATGEIFRNARFTAAHLTLPLGTWVEVTARATGKKIRCRINDRGPYVKKFVLDLSQAAARALGVDRAVDRHVEIRIVALPGEKPLPEGWDLALAHAEATAAATGAMAQ